jgi:hypothetical protein
MEPQIPHDAPTPHEDVQMKENHVEEANHTASEIKAEHVEVTEQPPPPPPPTTVQEKPVEEFSLVKSQDITTEIQMSGVFDRWRGDVQRELEQSVWKNHLH